MILNVAMISCPLNDCTNRIYGVFDDLFVCDVMFVFNWAPRKNTLCNWPPSINVLINKVNR